ncbi:MAG: hypothetical protein IIB60_00255 [Planctomycetes bacterium]|nr:hypothetical protein [Planctomycetota bacterium]
MNDRMVRYCLVAALIVLVVGGAETSGQQTAAPDLTIGLNEGVHRYLQGLSEDERTLFEEAIERFTAVLGDEPDNRAALLFRALSHGEIGLLVRQSKDDAADLGSTLKKLLDIRENPERHAALEQERDTLSARLEEESLSPQDYLSLDQQRKEIEGTLRLVELRVQRSVEQLREDLAQSKAKFHADATREREAYSRMVADLERLIKTVHDPDAMVRLLEAVAQTKVSRLLEEEGMRVIDGSVTAEDASAPAQRLASEAVTLLERAALTLEGLVTAAPAGMDIARTKFFLGVVRFRQGAPRKAGAKPDMARLGQAKLLMLDLVDNESTERRWRSYAALYLGLIIPFEALDVTNPAQRNAIYDEAESRLHQARELDIIVTRDEAGNVDPTKTRSASNYIPRLVRDHGKKIDDGRKLPLGSANRNDIQLSIFAGAHRDTNVVLLGERADLPRGVSREKDFGFTTGLVLGYTWDITDRWSFGAVGRVSQLWHADVDEFDQQDYGASVALQYEIVRGDEAFGPVYLRLQYDYSLSLLGRAAFLESHALTPNVRIYWANRRAETNVYFSYDVRDYHEPLFDRRFNRDGEYLALGVSQSFKVVDMTARYQAAGIEPWGFAGDEELGQDDPDYPKRYLTPYVDLQYQWDQTTGEEFDQKAFVMVVGVGFPLPWGIDLDAAVDFEWQRYQNGSLVDFHRRERRDFIQRYELAVSRTFVVRAGRPENRSRPAMDRVLMTLRAHATFTHDDSNVVDRLGQAIFQYDRTVYGLSVAFTFN